MCLQGQCYSTLSHEKAVIQRIFMINNEFCEKLNLDYLHVEARLKNSLSQPHKNTYNLALSGGVVLYMPSGLYILLFFYFNVSSEKIYFCL